jgi:uncharacterized protein
MIRELMLPSAYSHPVDQVDLIETHISWVLVAGEYVYKLKKPLDLGFLDFTTIERRQQACEGELRGAQGPTNSERFMRRCAPTLAA